MREFIHVLFSSFYDVDYHFYCCWFVNPFVQDIGAFFETFNGLREHLIYFFLVLCCLAEKRAVSGRHILAVYQKLVN